MAFDRGHTEEGSNADFVVVTADTEGAEGPSGAMSWTETLTGGLVGGRPQWYTVKRLNGHRVVVTVIRRFSHFRALRDILQRLFPLRILPKVGDKTAAKTGERDATLIRDRTCAFQTFLEHVLSHRSEDMAHCACVVAFMMQDPSSWEATAASELKVNGARNEFPDAKPAAAISGFVTSFLPAGSLVSEPSPPLQVILEGHRQLEASVQQMRSDFTASSVETVCEYLQLLERQMVRLLQSNSNQASQAMTVSQLFQSMHEAETPRPPVGLDDDGTEGLTNSVASLGAFKSWTQAMAVSFAALGQGPEGGGDELQNRFISSAKICRDAIASALEVLQGFATLQQTVERGAADVLVAQKNLQFVVTNRWCDTAELAKRESAVKDATKRSEDLSAQLTAAVDIVAPEVHAFCHRLQEMLRRLTEMHHRRTINVLQRVTLPAVIDGGHEAPARQW